MQLLIWGTGNNQTAATICLYQMMNDSFYNLPGGLPTSADYPSPAWWATQRGGPNAGIAYVAVRGDGGGGEGLNLEHAGYKGLDC